MKKELFVNPEAFFALPVLASMLISACGAGIPPAPAEDVSGIVSISAEPWSLDFDPGNYAGGAYSLSISDSEHVQADSLHFQNSEVADSLVFTRQWEIGSRSLLLFSVTVPPPVDSTAYRRILRILESASPVPPPGLRGVYLSDRSYSEIDLERASPSVEPPPAVYHHLLISFNPGSSDSCLVIRDSVVVDFTVSNADSMIFMLDQGEGSREFVVYPDSFGLNSRVYTGVLGINRVYTGQDGSVIGHARLTSAYLTGRGFFPLSATTQNYTTEFLLPDSIHAWTPLREISENHWQSGPGGITGGLPIAMGSYITLDAGYGYSTSVLTGGTPDSIDARVIETASAVLHSTLDFPSADFSFIEIQNPDGNMVYPVFGGIFFSRGSLEPLGDVSGWDEEISTSRVPAGCEILGSMARGLLMQSLKLDPVLEEMLISWLPLRYYAHVQDDPDGLITLREGYMKYYLFSTETTAAGADSAVAIEYSIADPMLASSPLRPFVTGGKGVILLEYLNSQGLLRKLPDLLQGFTHSWSSNYWPRIYSTLLYNDKLTDQYQELLRNFFYLPGIPQVTVDWRELDGIIYMEPLEIQAGIPFDIPLDSVTCMIHLQDTSFQREVNLQDGVFRCRTDFPEGITGSVNAIDLNHERILPADFMYRRTY